MRSKKYREKKRFYWRQEETQYFMTLCLKRNAMSQLGILTKGNAFELLAQDMRDVGFDKSAQQCRTKLKHLKMNYKRHGKEMQFADIMEKIMENLRANEPFEYKYKQQNMDDYGTNYSSNNIIDIKNEIEDSDAGASYGCESNDAHFAEIEDYTTFHLQDINDGITENDNNTNESNINSIESITPLRKEKNFQYELLNNLMKSQQQFVSELLEMQRKLNTEMIEKMHKHQSNQLNIIMNGFTQNANTKN